MADPHTNREKHTTEPHRKPTPWDSDYVYPDPEEVVAPIVEEFKKDLDKIFPDSKDKK